MTTRSVSRIRPNSFIASWPHVPVGERKRSSFKTDHDATDMERIGRTDAIGAGNCSGGVIEAPGAQMSNHRVVVVVRLPLRNSRE